MVFSAATVAGSWDDTEFSGGARRRGVWHVRLVGHGGRGAGILQVAGKLPKKGLRVTQGLPPLQDVFRDILSNFAASVTVVTGHTQGWHHGLTVSAFTSVSLDPPLVLICIDHASQSIKALRAAEGFTVNMLREGTGQVALRFASKATDKFSGLAVRPPTYEGAGLCLPEQSYASLECRKVEFVEAGDHTIFVGHVEHATRYDPGEPLLYWQRDFRRIRAD